MVRLYLKYSSRKRVCAEKAARNNMLLSHHSVSKLQSTMTAPIAAMITIQPRVRGYSRKTWPSFTALLFSLIANDIFFPLLFISSISVGTLLHRSAGFPACKSAGRFSSKLPVCHSLIDGNSPLDHRSFYLLRTPACPFHSRRTVRIGERAVAAAAAAKAGILFLFFRMIVMTDFFIHNFPLLPDHIKNASAFLPRRARCEAPS